MCILVPFSVGLRIEAGLKKGWMKTAIVCWADSKSSPMDCQECSSKFNSRDLMLADVVDGKL